MMRTKREPLIYSEEFKSKCKLLYPDYDELHVKLNENNYFVGRYLDDSFLRAFPLDAILNATNLEYLKEMALLEKRNTQYFPGVLTMHIFQTVKLAISLS